MTAADHTPDRPVRDARRSRLAILEAAEQVFADKGPAATVNEIVALAGLNKRMVYHYFSNKNGLWYAVLQRQYEKVARIDVDVTASSPARPVQAADQSCTPGRVHDHQRPACPADRYRSTVDRPGRSLQQLLEQLIRRYYQFLRDDRRFVRILAWENLQQGRTMQQLDLHEGKLPLIAALQDALHRSADSHPGRRQSIDDPQQLLISCMAMCYFYFSNMYTLQGLLQTDLDTPAAHHQRLDHVVQLITRAVLHRT